MNTAAPQIGSVFGQIHGAQPLHHSVVGPLGDLRWGHVVLDNDDNILLNQRENQKLSGGRNRQSGFRTKGVRVIVGRDFLCDTSSEGRRLRQLGS